MVNTCLKRVFTIFNIFFAIVGGVILALALLCQVLTNSHGERLEGRASGLILLYVVGIITMMIAILGAYGAHKESRVCLIVFLVCMVIGTLLTLRTGVVGVITRPQIQGVLEHNFRELLPLDKASETVKEMAYKLQTQLHCCGLFSYEDWEGDIPNSCICSKVEEIEGECRPVSYSRTMVYTKACFPIILHYAMLGVDIMIGVIFTLAVLAVLGMVLSSIMIHQMRYPERPTILAVPTIFTAPLPKYQELQNPPHY